MPFFDEQFRSVSMEGERWSVTMPGGRLCGFAMQPASELGHHIVLTGLGHVQRHLYVHHGPECQPSCEDGAWKHPHRLVGVRSHI